MTSVSTKQWEKLKQWSPALLYIAGSLYVLQALPNFIEFRPLFINFLGPVLYYLRPISSILGITGIIGLYPNLSDQAPQLSQMGVVLLVISAVIIMVGFIANQLIKLNQSQSLIPILSFIRYTTFTTLFVGYLLFGTAVCSTDSYPNALGYLLLIPVVLTVIEFTITIIQVQGNMIRWVLMATVTIQALDYIAYIINKKHTLPNPR